MEDRSNNGISESDETVKCCGMTCWKRKPRIPPVNDIYNTAARQTERSVSRAIFYFGV